MKGRLIGREGRNIRALEQATGVDLIIDDTPESVTISSFDPVRREIAEGGSYKSYSRWTIHPARIEEVVEKAKIEVESTIRIEGEQAARKTGIQGLHPELIKLLGRLKYRTSYGQNVMTHSMEVAHIAVCLPQRLEPMLYWLNGPLCYMISGKAVDHEVEGPHALIGANLVKQWDKSAEIVQAISEHHGEATTTSSLGFILALQIK